MPRLLFDSGSDGDLIGSNQHKVVMGTQHPEACVGQPVPSMSNNFLVEIHLIDNFKYRNCVSERITITKNFIIDFLVFSLI